MRNLTIKRKKRFVACLSKMKVYAEDIAGDMIIGGVLCKKLGELKNGGEATFQIEERSMKIFVIADRLTKELCYDCYQLSEGSDDLVLTGQNIFNLLLGNPFRFDGNTCDETTLKRQKKATVRSIVLVVVCFLIGVAIGLAGVLLPLYFHEVSPKTFTSAGLTITLTDEFSEVEQEGFPVCFGTKDVAVITVKEEFSLMEGLGDKTLDEYGDLFLQNNTFNNMRKFTEGERTYVEYEATPDGDHFYYLGSLYKTDDSFWIVYFAVAMDKKGDYVDTFKEWASTVSFE